MIFFLFLICMESIKISFVTNQTNEFGRIKQKNNLTQLKLLIWQVQAGTVF